MTSGPISVVPMPPTNEQPLGDKRTCAKSQVGRLSISSKQIQRKLLKFTNRQKSMTLLRIWQRISSERNLHS